MVFHMLRWEMATSLPGHAEGALSQYADSSMRSSDFGEVAEAQSQQQLTAFFAQMDRRQGAPAFH